MTASNAIREKSYSFALKIIRLNQFLMKKNEFVLGRQVLKSGTSIGANVEEALQGQSRKDFISKLSISLKEASETRFWLRLLRDSQLVPASCINPLEQDTLELLKLLTSIIKSTKIRGE